MTILEMHEYFRALGQQMGMQTIRGILPEDIDIYLNIQIINKVRSVVLENTTTIYNDKVTMQRNSISPINAIRTLYEKKNIGGLTGDGSKFVPYSVELSFDDKVMYYTGFNLYYDKHSSFKCRILNGDVLEDTINDYCNRSTWDNPIIDLKSSNNKLIADIYTDISNHTPYYLGVRYIRKPNKVHYSEDGSADVHCDLPEHLHGEIVGMAVNEYFKSVGSTQHNIN